MTDIETAKAGLIGHTLSLCKGKKRLYSDKRGIAPMVGFIAANEDLAGFSAADLIVGKAAALLFVKAGIREVYAQTLSESGKAVLLAHGIPFSYRELTPKIVNRLKTDVCPMEKAVRDTDDPERAYALIVAALEKLGRGNAGGGAAAAEIG